MPESKAERAQLDPPKESRRENFLKPGTWASELMRIGVTRFEDLSRLTEMHASGYRRVPFTQFTYADYLQMRKWRNFRKLALRQGNPDTSGWENEDFSPSDEVFMKYISAGDAMADFSTNRPGARPDLIEMAEFRKPFADLARVMPRFDHVLAPIFLEWMRSSRKVFTLSEQSQNAFSRLDFSETTWRNIMLPHRSFAIELAHPIVGEIFDGRVFVHAVIVADIVIAEQESVIIVPLVTREVDRTSEMFSKGIRSVMEQANQSVKHLLRASQVAGHTAHELMDPVLMPMPMAFDMNAPVDSADDDGFEKELKKIVAGMSASLASDALSAEQLPHSAVHEGGRDADAYEFITDPEEIFMVGASFGSPHQVETVVKNIKRYLSQRASPKRHPVRKHMRRAPGSPPDAPKTIEVRAQWRGEVPDEGELPIVNTRKID